MIGNCDIVVEEEPYQYCVGVIDSRGSSDTESSPMTLAKIQDDSTTVELIYAAKQLRMKSGNSSAQAVGNPEPLVVSVKAGESVTISCTITDQKSKVMFWFKQRLEHMPLEVGYKLSNKTHALQNPFRDSKSGFQLQQTASGVSLIIGNVSKEDEGMYFCGEAEQSIVKFSNGTFLAVSGHSNISVDQTPVLESVSSGESVTLQCTVLSEIHSEDLRVLWFRSAAGRSLPEIIYTDHNSSSCQCETSSSPHSCVYNFSKNILNDSDAGTYYCAVSTCGKIIIGNGTTVCQNLPDSPVLMALMVFSVVCVVVICAQAVVIVKIRRSGQHTEKLRQGAVIENASNQGGNAESLNYAAVQFKEKKPKREDRRRRKEPEELVYSQVRTSTATGPRPKR
ncbi:uncharacterized protein [Salminus brasiliensis]|uniref:uncharacterized protein n=1 Tax=Salminus brasiliensis TaxID=930266 RepID=UPI003B839F8A